MICCKEKLATHTGCRQCMLPQFQSTVFVTLICFLRYFTFEPSFKLRWCLARDLFESEIPVTTGGFELRILFIRISYLTHEPSGLGN